MNGALEAVGEEASSTSPAGSDDVEHLEGAPVAKDIQTSDGKMGAMTIESMIP